MKRFSKQELSSAINNGDAEVLVYLANRFFPGTRRLLRIRGIPDEATPRVFSEVLATSFSELRLKSSHHVDFETYFMNALAAEIRRQKESARGPEPGDATNQEPEEIVSQCISILPEQSRKLLFARVAERRSYEEIAGRFQFSNAIIAEYEIDKAMTLLEGIVRLRFNISND